LLLEVESHVSQRLVIVVRGGGEAFLLDVESLVSQRIFIGGGGARVVGFIQHTMIIIEGVWPTRGGLAGLTGLAGSLLGLPLLLLLLLRLLLRQLLLQPLPG
jgi:hypothetical protein